MTPRRPIILLTIAGSDSGGGAGIQADLPTFAAHGAYGLSALTAVTAQDTLAVHAVHALPPELVAAQIDAAFGDVGVDGVKIGMLGSAAVARAVAERLAVHLAGRPIPVVLDPVLAATAASAGAALLEEDALPILLDRLLPLATVVTPNLPELERLTGLPATDEPSRLAAARALARRGPAVLAKGGHAPGDEIVDLLVAGGEVHRFRSARLATRAGHGTGCTLSAALAARLAAGEPLARATEGAIEYVRRAILAAPGVGRGRGPLGHPGR
ncbi:MAG TPA: bifunctional hydroxymethylpyrimidine kinase/phosphomethylpyrimidine kinase [Thermoanaerobaculia bacterium]